MSDRIDWYNLIASERDLPPFWRWHTLQSAGSDTVVTGAVRRVLFKRGPRKDTENWAKRDKHTERTIVITREQYLMRRARWEKETGKCSTCQGSGHEVAGWSVHEGTMTKPCARCKSTGKAPEVTP